MSKILIIEDEILIQKLLNEVPKEKIITISSIETHLLQYNDIILNNDTYEVFRNSEKIDLTMKEYQILKLLIENPNKVYSKEELLEKIWKYNYSGDEQVVYSHIKNIRKKIGDDIIKTTKGIGYRI